ncbi:hypothetical protein CPB83DRAFT_840938 [Crepidotus variabilis]|uniref:Uncharacterized protein n=1 Tax=Crepidotus variabilis TaxID=179855 RepID=A0A9P6E3H1_9AGAR|nr:hypothetical protein CPB83DRAFT_840938 [Crepidotus variabilis]
MLREMTRNVGWANKESWRSKEANASNTRLKSNDGTGKLTIKQQMEYPNAEESINDFLETSGKKRTVELGNGDGESDREINDDDDEDDDCSVANHDTRISFWWKRRGQRWSRRFNIEWMSGRRFVQHYRLFNTTPNVEFNLVEAFVVVVRHV